MKWLERIVRTAAAVWILVLLLGAIPEAGSAYAASTAAESFTVALTGKYPPFSFYSDEAELVGFDVDVSQLVAEKLNRELRIVTTEWDGILGGLLAGKYDAIIGSMAITPERAKSVDFTMPYYVSGAQLFVHVDDAGEIQSLKDMEGKKAGAVLGETFEHYLVTNHPEISVVTYKSTVDIFQEMQHRRLDGFVTDRLVGMYQIKSAQMPFVPAGPLLYEEQMAIPVKQDQPELLAAINQALTDLEAGGELAKLHEKWFASIHAAEDESVAATGSAEETGGMSWGTIAVRLLRGFGITLLVAFLSIAMGFILAVPAGVVLHGAPRLGQTVVRAIVDFIRGTPVLIQLFFVYFGSPQIGLNLSPMVAAVVTLTINSTAYMSEVVRSGLLAVSPGQRVAARALGLSPFEVFRFVVWPQALRVALPPLMNSAVALLKDTALISVISVAEVIREAQSIISVTFDPAKYYLIVAVMFFVFTYPLMRLASAFEAHMKKRGFAGA